MRQWIHVVALSLAVACGSSAPEPTPGPPVAPPRPAIDASPKPEPGPKPAFLEEVEALVRGLCECATPECIEERYVAFHRRLDGQSLEGWTPPRIRELHVMRARGEDCNLSMLTGGDAALLETAREAFLDGYAARAPVLLTQLYDAAVARHGSGAQLPESIGPTPEKGRCCEWSDGLCPATEAWWSDPAWSELGFRVTEAQAYSYALVRDGTVVTVQAFGDLDCDGEFSTYELRGDVNTEPHPQIRMTERLE